MFIPVLTPLGQNARDIRNGSFLLLLLLSLFPPERVNLFAPPNGYDSITSFEPAVSFGTQRHFRAILGFILFSL